MHKEHIQQLHTSKLKVCVGLGISADIPHSQAFNVNKPRSVMGYQISVSPLQISADLPDSSKGRL